MNTDWRVNSVVDTSFVDDYNMDLYDERLRAVKVNGLIHKIDQTPEICLEALKEKSMAVSYVNPKLITEGLCYNAIQYDTQGVMIGLIQDSCKSYRVCM